MPPWLLYLLIGTTGGVAAGVFGIGGGIILVPALVYFAGFSQHQATGTTLAVLLPPIGLAAALEYYRHGNVNVRAAVILAITMFLGAWLGAILANGLDENYLHLSFGVFMCLLGIYISIGAVRQLGWL